LTNDKYQLDKYQLYNSVKKKGEHYKSTPLGKVRKVEGTTFPTWLDANKLAPLKDTNYLL